MMCAAEYGSSWLVNSRYVIKCGLTQVPFGCTFGNGGTVSDP